MIILVETWCWQAREKSKGEERGSKLIRQFVKMIDSMFLYSQVLCNVQ